MQAAAAAFRDAFLPFRAVPLRGTGKPEIMEAATEPGRDLRQDSELLELSNAMVRIYKERFGRGATKTKTSYADPDTIISTLEDSLTAVERSMRDLGEPLRVEEIRLFFQRASQAEFIGVVEQITGRKVRAFVSGHDVKTDVASEIFYLKPRS
jgi:uncharacterized protein YbcI